MMNIKEKRIVVEPTEVLEDVPLEKSNLEKFTRIRTSMEEKTKQELVRFLRKKTDVFAWSHEDMLGIDQNVITHHLNVSLFYKLVHQKKRVFALKRHNKRGDLEVRSKFIREVYYPDWLVNVVMVKKSNGNWRMCVDFTNLYKICPKDSYSFP